MLTKKQKLQTIDDKMPYLSLKLIFCLQKFLLAVIIVTKERLLMQ